MYIIFDYKLGLLQFGFRSLQDACLQHGVIINARFERKIGTSYLNFEDEYFVFNTSYFVIKNPKNSHFDCRFDVQSLMLKKLILIFLNAFLKFKSFKKMKQINFYALYFILIFSLFCTLPLYFYQSPVAAYSGAEQWTHTQWKEFFSHTALADYIAHNKYDGAFGEIPKISGISEFRVLPLINFRVAAIHFSSLLAVPFKRSIVVKKSGNSLHKNAFFSCPQGPFSFFKITEEDEAALLLQTEHVGEGYAFRIFKEGENLSGICESLLKTVQNQKE